MTEAWKTNELIVFLREAGKLKSIAREGWRRVGVSEPESVADHSYRLAVMAMLLGEKFGLNAGKMVKMALIHDLGEVEAGDITPHDGTSREEKRDKERKAVKDLLSGEYFALWEEYDLGTSEEAWFLKQLDKLEMALQALDYEERLPDLSFDDFWKTAEAEIRISSLAEILKALEAMRVRLQK